MAADTSLLPTHDEAAERAALHNATTDLQVAQIMANRLDGRTSALSAELRTGHRARTASVIMLVLMVFTMGAIMPIMT